MHNRDDLDVSVAVAPNLTAALTQFDDDLINFVVAESVVTDTALLAPFGGPFVQLPLTASAIVMGYHLPELNATTDTLVFDLPTLARIWRGDITLWNDSAIAALNPAIALKLPGEPIELLYKRNADPLRADVTTAFTKALCHDAAFAAAFEAAGGSLYDLLGGSGYANNNLTNRQARLASAPYTLSYFRLVDTMGISYSVMKDANGTTVAPSATTVQSALAWYRTTVFDNQFVADISNGGNGSWPLTYLAAVVIVPLNASIATNCPQVKDLLDYVSWTQVRRSLIAIGVDGSLIVLMGINVCVSRVSCGLPGERLCGDVGAE
jgi:phosphate transport system substrate-binding protein